MNVNRIEHKYGNKPPMLRLRINANTNYSVSGPGVPHFFDIDGNELPAQKTTGNIYQVDDSVSFVRLVLTSDTF